MNHSIIIKFSIPKRNGGYGLDILTTTQEGVVIDHIKEFDNLFYINKQSAFTAVKSYYEGLYQEMSRIFNGDNISVKLLEQ